VLFGGSILGLLGAMYFWWPKIFGRMLSERLGTWNFWVVLIGFNLTFGPMHVLGLEGQPRRMYVYDSNMSFDLWNAVATIGAFTLAFGILLFLVNAVRSRKSPPAPLDPWDARSLEWLTASPPHPHNFDAVPTVHSLDEFYHRKYEEDENGFPRRIKTAEELAAEAPRDAHIHLPSPSYWPIVLAFGLPFIMGGLIFNYWISFFGVAVVVLALFGWALEPATAEDAGGGEPHAAPHEEIAPVG
jgi:cytochrome c oxidase subunit 1